MAEQTSRIVLWEPCPLYHTENLVSALHDRAPHLELICCADHDLPRERMALGLADGEARGFERIVAPSDDVINELVRSRVSESLHIFVGIRWLHTLVTGIESARRSGARLAIMSEPRVREGWKGELRFLQSWLTEGWFRRNAAFVLAIGQHGPPWFRSVGYQSERVFPFAYFVDPPEPHAVDRSLLQGHDGALRIGYAGRLEAVKGVDELVHAVARLGSEARLIVAGTGHEEARLRDLCGELEVDARFCGARPSNTIGDFMSALDVLVLPTRSTNDGWGVVVSEALMTGTAVIATQASGASVMLSEPSFGIVVPTRSPDSIAKAVLSLRDSEAFTVQARSRRMELARARLSASAGASYLLDIIRWSEGHSLRPTPFYLDGAGETA